MNRRTQRRLLILAAVIGVWVYKAHPLWSGGPAPRRPAPAAAATAPVPDATIRRGVLTLSACELRAEWTPVPPVAAYCAYVNVPEDRADPGRRSIALRVAVIPAQADRPAADAVTFLDGGPGGAATADYPLVAGEFAPLHKTRDILLIDQRGTGLSHPLTCTQSKDAPSASRVRACAAEVNKNADTRDYTTVDATADLNQVRRTLGYPQLTLIGVSYGTRVAQVYARDYPESVRAVVLDSPVPNSLILGSEHARNLETVLRTRFDACVHDTACAQRFGNPYQTLTELEQRLEKTPVDVTIADPTTHVPRHEHLTREGLAALTRLYAYSPVSLALLPLTLDEAKAGHYEALLGQLLLVQSDLSTRLDVGMELSVICSEDADRLVADPADAHTVLGADFATHAKAVCAEWPHAPMPAHFHDPLTGAVPTLLLSGEFDPVTPPRYATEIARHLTNARVLVLPGQGHSVMGIGCAPQVVEHFVDKARVQGLETECLQRERAAPFFLGYSGSAP
jgi:pimeloyl-ACP methyl ester carboxylesterase